MQEIIQIQARAKRNGFFLLLMGGGGFVLAFCLFSWLPKHLSLLGILVCSASIVATLLAWFKLREPAYSMELSRRELCYKHRLGQWSLSWDNIQRIDTPKVNMGMELQALELVGIKIKDYQALLDSISPRLVSNLLMQQRPLLLYGRDEACSSGQCYADDLLEEDYFKSPNGKIYTGLKAMLAHRMHKLRTRLGYDLYIANAELDCSTEEFVNLLRQCQSQSQTGPEPGSY